MIQSGIDYVVDERLNGGTTGTRSNIHTHKQNKTAPQSALHKRYIASKSMRLISLPSL